MNPFVMIMQQYFGDFERVVELAATNKMQRGNNGNPLLPISKLIPAKFHESLLDGKSIYF